MVELTDRLANLSPAKRRLLQERLRAAGVATPTTVAPLEPVDRAGRGGWMPLSFAQERLWVLDQLEPGSAAYSIPAAVRLGGDLDRAALAAALGGVVERHEILRAVFRADDDGPEQSFPPVVFALPVVDLGGLRRGRREEEARRLVRPLARQPFDLVRGPVLRSALIALGDRGQGSHGGDHLLALAVHHAVADGWSMGLLVREVGELYAARVESRTARLPRLPIQYADFAVWQREHLTGDVLEGHLDYWRRRLDGLEGLVTFLPDRPRPRKASSVGGSRPFSLDRDTTELLHRAAAGAGVQLFALLAGLFQLLLARHAGVDDVPIGVPVAQRTQLETEPSIGLYVDTVVLRTDLGDDPTVGQLLRRVQDAMVEAREHQELPFERLVDELSPERSLAHAPLFQVMLGYQPPALVAGRVADLTLEPVAVDSGAAKLDVTLLLEERDGGLTGTATYATSLYDDATVEALLERYGELLQRAAANPGARLSDLPVTTRAERARLLDVWGLGGPLPTGADEPIPDRFARQARQTPDALAVVDGETELTYAELAARVARLAAALRRLDPRPEVPVGVLLERGADLVVALLAVLDSGAPYLPLESSQPAERLRTMIEDAGADTVLVAGPTADHAAVPDGRRLDLAAVESSAPSVELAELAARAPIEPDSLAYLIYTSGSTGVPKAVAITHRSAGALVSWAAEAFDTRELTGVLAATSVGFDLSVFELFVPLSTGGAVIVAGSVLDLPRLPARERVSLVNTVPSAMAELIAQEPLPRSVRVVALAGEPYPAGLAERLHRAGTLGRTLNLYGPSEDTTYSTFGPVASAELAPTLGRPVAGTAVRLLDPRLAPVPPGVAGELCLAGAGLARGYLGRPAATAARFVPDPFATGPGDRLYRTGDLARWLPDGRLDYLGRFDHQIKLRGFRIELEEVEAVLAGHDDLSEAAVLVDATAGEPRLVAYFVPVGDGDDGDDRRPAVRELAGWLAARLPSYMVPAAFVRLDAFPRTASGKLDRRALARWGDGVEISRQAPYQAPRTALEHLIAGLWTSLLRRPGIGVHDNFFELGGHSLGAARLAARLGQELGRDVSLETVFDAPTVAELAVALGGADDLAATVPLVPRPDGDRHRPLPLSHAQERLWFLDRFEGGSASLNLPLSTTLRGALDPAALAAALNELVRRHEILRTVFVERDGTPRQVVLEPTSRPLPSLPVVDLSGLADPSRVADRAEATQHGRSLDLVHGPLFVARLLRLGPREHRLVMTLHHIVGDGWSNGLLTAELAALYGAERGVGEAPPEPAIQYGDFTLWQRQVTSDEALDAGVEAWRRRLEGAPELLELPTDRPRPAVQTYRGAGHRVTVPAPVAQRLGALGMEQRASRFMVMLAVFQVLLGRWSGQDDLVVGVPIAGRGNAQLDRTLGLFLNSMALRGDLSGDPPFRRLVERTREAALEAYGLQDVPFERVLEAVRPTRDLSRTPLFQVFFNLLSFPDERLEVDDLALETHGSEDLPSKFDLTVYLREDEGAVDLHLVYNADLFHRPTIEHLAAQYLALCAQVAEAPETRLSELDLVTAEARALLPDPAAPLDDTWRGPVHEWVARQAAEDPDRLAVSAPDGVWTYGELVAESHRLAHLLVDRGVRPGDAVAIHAVRRGALVPALLGTLEAGGALIVLDPSYPAERRVACLELAVPRAWIDLTDDGPEPAVEAALDALPAGCTRLRLPTADLLDFPATPVGVTVGADDPAVLGFTSGSTGTPKGIVGRHGPLTHFLPWQSRVLGMGADDRFSMLSALAHDPLQRDVFTPLALGASLHVPEGDSMAEPGWLADWLAREGITVAHMTPATGQMITEGLGEDGPRATALRRILLVGEALTRRDVERLRHLAPGVTAINLYGSTETQRAVGYHVVDPAPDVAGHQVLPLGRGMEDVQLLVLAASGRLAGVGELGEIAVRSPHLATGYLGDPERTAERFVLNPVTGTPGDRLYRTGDLGRYRADGEVTFAGRVDRQIQVRGFRIEPAEIEVVLGRHPALGEVVVHPFEVPGTPARLVAYCVLRGEERPAPARLAEFARESLPLYMVPAAFVWLERLPLTANRKVDRRALPAPAEWTAGGAVTVAPRDRTEAALLELWRELLPTEDFGVEDDFFVLGGHSLLATRLAAAVRDRLGVEVPLKALFEAPTVAGMARLVAAADGASPRQTALPALVPRPAEAHEPFPLTDVQQAYWVGRSGAFALGSVSTHVYFEIEARELDLPRLEAVWRRLVERHGMLRMVVDGDGRQRILERERVEPYPIAVDELAPLDPDERERRLAARRERMSHQVLPSDRWPLFEIAASRLDDQRVRLHASFDLLIADALSFRILEREVLALYREPDAELAPLGATFRDYVLALVALEGSEPFERSLAYWRRRAEQLPPAPDLPLARDPESLVEHRFSRRAGRLDPQRWAALQARGRRLGLTPSGLLAAAFSDVLAAWAKSPRFTINLTLFNRLPLHPDTDRIVGDFTSLSFLEVDAASGAIFAQRARALQSRLWDDLDHRHVSGIRVLREMRSTGGGPGAMPVVFTSTLGLPAKKSAELRRTLDAELVTSISQTPQVWLDHQAAEVDGELALTWDAVEELFPPGLLDDAWATYLELLVALADDELPWEAEGSPLPPAHRRSIDAANDTVGAVPTGLLHEPLLDQARRAPDRPAVFAGGRTLTYGELAERSLRVARALPAHGVGPGVLVAVALDKGIEQVIATLAVVRAGGAYLPLDPGLPAQRLRSLVERGDCPVVLTRRELGPRLELPPGVPWIAVDDLSDEDEGAAAAELPRAAEDDLAYVIFTSGSTGQPKGVMIEHGAALNTVVDVNRRFGIGPDDRVLALSALSFDLSVWDLFGVLGAGGAVVMPEPEASRDPSRWAELVRAHGVTVWNTVPALMDMLVEYLEALGETLPELRLVMMSGDWIPVRLPDRIRPLLGDVEVVSLGGATEASIWSILFPVGEVPEEWTSIPYGRGMANQTFHVLDHRLAPRPVWVPGELYIGGRGVARGYWKDPERTADSFFDHPRSGRRLYRTGDLGRLLPSGDIEFLGREDSQVKVGGYRIELGEIEAGLATHPEVRSVAVTVAGSGQARRLVAHVVTGGRAAETGAERPTGEASEAAAPDPGAVGDHLERLEFKLEQRGVRGDLPREGGLSLAAPTANGALLDAYRHRASERAFAARSVALADLASLLHQLVAVDLPERPLPKYRYPSAGSLYPVQVYLEVRPGRVDGLAGGLFYHHPRDHRLARLARQGEPAELGPEVHAQVNRALSDDSAFTLWLVADLDAIEPLYGDVSRDFCLIEAGAITQLLATGAAARGLGLCPAGGFDRAAVASAFGLGERREVLLSLVGGASRRAVATVAADAGDTAEDDLAARLTAHLADRLPAYMVPTTFDLLFELPLTANGKVDRKALEARATADPATPASGAATTSPTPGAVPSFALEGDLARRLREVISQVLELDQVGPDDTFFELGGTSVHVIRVHARLRDELGIEVPIVEIFEHPTVRSLARRLAREVALAPGRTPSVSVPAPSTAATPPVSRPAPEGDDEPHAGGRAASYMALRRRRLDDDGGDDR